MRREIVKLILQHAKEADKNNLAITIKSTSDYCRISKATANTYLLNLVLGKELKMSEEGENENYKYKSWSIK